MEQVVTTPLEDNYKFSQTILFEELFLTAKATNQIFQPKKNKAPNSVGCTHVKSILGVSAVKVTPGNLCRFCAKNSITGGQQTKKE